VGYWTTYRTGDDIREDWTTNSFGYDVTDIAFVTSDRMESCNATPFDTNCTVVNDRSLLDAPLIFFTPIKDYPAALLSDTGPNYQVTPLPDETIAETDAKCFDVAVEGRIGDGPPGTEQVKLCFSSEGALLAYDRAITFESAGFESARLTAIAEDVGEVVESDFQSPGNPTQPTGGGG
jgi:hypothetical protein